MSAASVAAAPAPAGAKAKSDDDVRLGAEAEPPRSSVVGGQSSSDLSELNKQAPAKSSRAEEVLKQQEQLNATVGSGAATNEITRGKPAEQPVSSPKPVEAGEDEKKNRDNLANARDGLDKDTGRDAGGAYYDRDAGTFATYQRSLCNKCHVQD